MKNQKGITLIALIVTVIILLILAAITLGLLANSGIIRYGMEAEQSTELEYLREQASFVLDERAIQRTAYGSTTVTLKQDLENGIAGAIVKEQNENTCTVTRDGHTITVYDDGTIEDGTVEIWDGTILECPELKEFEWYIYNAGQLKFFANYVNNDNSLTGTYGDLTQYVVDAGYDPNTVTMSDTTVVYLMNNIDMNNEV